MCRHDIVALGQLTKPVPPLKVNKSYIPPKTVKELKDLKRELVEAKAEILASEEKSYALMQQMRANLKLCVDELERVGGAIPVFTGPGHEAANALASQNTNTETEI
jgi:hypothetical protein